MTKRLNEMNTSAYQYLICISDQVEKICKPLSNLGISYFCYTRVFKNGAYLSVGSHLNYRKVYLSTIKSLDNSFVDAFNKPRVKDTYEYLLFPNDINQLEQD